MLEDIVADLDSAVYEALGEPVTPAAGSAFAGIFSVADVNAFDTAQVGDYTLRYPASAADLTRGDVLTIRGAAWRVAEHPRRIGDGRECSVGLMQESA